MTWFFAAEDALCEALGLRILAGLNQSCEPALVTHGQEKLRARTAALCQIARRRPVLVITDQDSARCAVAVRKKLLGAAVVPEGLAFRIAQREAEAWLLADEVAMYALLGAISKKIPPAVDEIDDPKRLLMTLAQSSSKSVRQALCVPKGAVASKGPQYNSVLCGIIRESWSPERAQERSPSLFRAIQKISAVTQIFSH